MPKISLPAERLYSAFLAAQEPLNFNFLALTPLISELEATRNGGAASEAGTGSCGTGVEECLR